MKTLAQKHPVITFLLINFVWTWLFWFAAILLRGQTLLVTAIVLIGGYGPAIGGILTLGLRSGQKLSMSPKRTLTMFLISALIFGVLTLRYLVGNIPNFDILAEDLTLTPPIVVVALIASLMGGWVFSSAVSDNSEVRTGMASILPKRLSPLWTLFAVLFYPVMILASWGLSALFGMNAEYPGLWDQSALEILPLYILTFCVTLLIQGGNEEIGWRGFMQPELQKRFSPLVAALIVSVFWSLWHLPLFLNGVYDADVVMGMVSGGIYRIPLAIFLAWFYNRSGGNLFLTMLLHASFNRTPSLLPTPSLMLMVLCLIVAVVMVVKDKMWLRISQS
jgi:membrane protease YdiL (CAAX protease family)